MKTASAGLIALLAAQNQFVCADLYTFTLADGTIVRYTSADINLVVNTFTFDSAGPKFTRESTRSGIGLEVDSLGVTITPKSTDLLQGLPWLQAALNGSLDGARVLVEKFISDAWTNTAVGALHQFSGMVSDVEVSRVEIKLTISADTELLAVQMPRNVIMAGCIHSLFDAGCGLVKATFSANSTCASGSTVSSINCGLAQASGYFTLGTILFTGGPNAGLKRTVRAYTPGVITPLMPLPYTPGVGDAFTATAGCDKMQATCLGKFNNLANFKGFPYVPVPETSM